MTIKTILLLMATTLLTSCSTTFYQLYDTKTSEGIVENKDHLIFEDDHCIISYNLWKNGGDIGFTFYNKTEEIIFLNLEESFFIRNGIAYDYYKDRIFESSLSSGFSNSASSSISFLGYNHLNVLNQLSVNHKAKTESTSGVSVSHFEKNIISIPPKTAKIISEYSISNSVYRDCNLFLHPSKSQIKTETFTKTNSPFKFSNQLSYQLENGEDLVKIDNSFYVSSITNYPEKEILKEAKDEFCGQKSMMKSKTFNSYSPNQFYIKYTKLKDWKH